MFQSQRVLFAVVTALGTLGAAGVSNAATIVTDTFSYNASSPAVAVAGYTYNDGSAIAAGSGLPQVTYQPNAIGGTQPAALTGQSVLQLNNTAIRRDLGTTLTSNFTLEVHALSTAYGRSQNFALLDSNGNGYGVNWDTSTPTQDFTNGHLRITRVTGFVNNAVSQGVSFLGSQANATTPLTGYNLTADGSAYATPTTFNGYNDFILSWNNGVMSLTENGVALGIGPAGATTLTDTTYTPGVGSFAGFTRVLLAGNTNMVYDDLTVSSNVPEPTSFAALALAAGVLTRRRRA